MCPFYLNFHLFYLWIENTYVVKIYKKIKQKLTPSGAMNVLPYFSFHFYLGKDCAFTCVQLNQVNLKSMEVQN